MEILKQGDLAKLDNKKAFVCNKCGCEFTADDKEYEPASQIDYIGNGVSAYCKCPCCGNLADSKR